MKNIFFALMMVTLAGCSGGGPDPQATATGDAAAAATTDAASARATEAPMTADRCIEENKGLGTGTRGENTKDCLVGACDQGDKKSCKMVESFAGEVGRDSPDDLPPEDGEEPAQ